MTKTKSILLSITLCSLVAFDASARYRGDLNGDDRVDLADMVYLAKAIKAGSTDKSLDVNASGKVDDYDLQKLADIIISGKLTEDSGMNVGIGGWEDDGEDYGGTVKAPAFNTRSADETRFYMRNPKAEGNDIYSMEFGISEGNEASAAILFSIRLPHEMSFDDANIVVLDPSVSATHKLYGTPKVIKENEDDIWSPQLLRFIVMSPDLNALPNSTDKLGRINYSVGDCWSSPMFVNCQSASAGSGECTDIPEHWADYSGNYKPVEISSVWFDQSDMNLVEGDEGYLYANIDPWDATDQDLVWTSSDESIAIVTANGKEATVTAVASGYAEIYASASNGKTATCYINVEARFIEVTDIVISNTELKMTEGDTATLTATVNPADATDKSLSWSSSDSSIVSVSADGEVKALKPGTATITVSSSNAKTATCAVTVAKRIVELTGIALSNNDLRLIEGESATLTAIIQPADATDKTLTWKSSDSSIATVSTTGDVNAIKAGTATITVSAANGITASCKVTVESGVVAVTEVKLDKTALEMTEGDAATLTATVNPSDATDKTLTWTSTDSSVASVSTNGEVKAMKAGTATIIVSSSNGKTAKCEVTVNAKVIEVSSVTLDQAKLDLTEGDSAILTAIVNPADATDKTLTWASSDATVASVSASGEVKALKPGTATITVSSSNGKTATCAVTVAKRIVELTGIALSNNDLRLIEGESATLTAIIQPADATDKTLTWKSSDSSIATVSTTGDVKAIKAGTATITVSAANGISASCKVTVESGVVVVTEVKLDKTSLEMTEGDAATLTATVNPSDATDKTLTWTSTDSSVASVSTNGEVKAMKAGTATIIVSSSNGKTAKCEVTVNAKVIEVSSVTLDQAKLDLTEGDSAILTAIVNPADATDKTLTWASSDATVASVSASGEVKALKPGTATITVSSSNAKTATCAVTVAKRIVEVTSIVLSNTELKLTEGESATLTAIIRPADATDKTLTWTSTNSSVASVSANGEVKALNPGTATIIVSSSNGKTARCEVYVLANEIKMERILLDVETLQLEVGDTYQLIATVVPDDTTDSELEWWIDDESVATVDHSGFVTLVGEGSTIVHVRSVRWSEIEATCVINVTDRVADLIEDSAPCYIYNSHGQLLKKAVPASEIHYLEPGIYIIYQNGKTIKLLK